VAKGGGQVQVIGGVEPGAASGRRPDSSSPARAADFQTWQPVSLKWLDTKDVALTTAMHTRLYDDISEFALWRIGQAVSTDPLPWLRAGVAYRYTESKNSAGDWRYQHRGEFQVPPHHRPGDRVSVSLRNRLELRWNEGVGGVNEVSRHRLQFSLAKPEWRPLCSVYVSNEIFHDYDRSVIPENRAVSLGLRFRPHEKANLSVFYMIRSMRGTDEWRHDQVLGTGLAFSL
jgi:hypothetical protein